MCRAIISSSLVGITHAAVRLAAVLMRGPCFAFARRVELDAEPGRLPAHPLADRRRVLADAGGEDDRVEAAERRGERAELAADPVDEEVDGELRPRLGRLEQRAHVARHARDAEQAGLAVDQLLDRPRVHPALVHQVQDDAGVDRPAARPHRQAVDRGEAHRARDAAAGFERAHAGAVAEVQHHGLAARRALVEPRQHRGDVLVGEAVEAVAAHARIGELLRQREHLRERRVRPVDRGVEARDLRQLRRALEHRADRRQVVRLVQRRERHELLELRDDRGVEAHGRGVVDAAVDDAVTDGREPVIRRRASPSASRRCARARRRARRFAPASQRFSPAGFPAASFATKCGAV